ncbi:MAG: ribonucleoside-triphosphate reductase-like protein [Candidatus Saganbacteria bacterium]|uniref:Ribonucleoside-triphosphate reductase-like protein n=1 Tax=Candidatus Saganbacteria bacterium TaxID=2575572 RepID=A0A833NY18_UNCSA|nr:MAG: ribonucleoside-triphosphate reductase-like protein [Candidatus Saganbacteria bacterium]
MDIRGFIETSLIDWDGKISSVIFVPNCNFRCPFCSNAPLLNNIESLPQIMPAKIDEFLKQRDKFIDGVVITGGEPTLQNDLPEYIKHLKSLGFLIKLDTNGSNPQMLKSLIENKLIDYAAMDIKAPLDERYLKSVGIPQTLVWGALHNSLLESLRFLIDSSFDYEFRTTVVPTFHDTADIEEIAKTINGAKRYMLQQFNPKDTLDPSLVLIKPYLKEKMIEIKNSCQKYVKTSLRGI